MNNTPELLLTLQQYIVELETENKALKSHIYNLQCKQQNMQATYHDQLQQLKVHIQHCQHEIAKREVREIGTIEMIQELEQAKQEIAKERDIYIQEIQNLQKENLLKQEQINKLNLQISVKPIPLPPKASKCKQCDLFIKNHQLTQLKIAQYEQIIEALKQDISCISEFL